jgi:UrcA family protein
MTLRNNIVIRRALCVAAAGGMTLAMAGATAHAQDRYGDAGYDQDSVEGVVVRPHGAVGHSALGDHDLVQASRVVAYRDLDLRSDRDAYILKTRIERAAHSACNELASRPEAQDEDSAFCYSDAVHDGMEKVAYTVGYEPEGW